MSKPDVTVIIRRPKHVRIIIVQEAPVEIQAPDGAVGLSDRAVTERWRRYLGRRTPPLQADGWRSE